ncbi:MAG TPA: sulfatase-like hydrolase/transferase [Actinomycetota bacterium]
MTDPSAPSDRGSAAPTVLRQELDYLLQVLGLNAFAVAQPVLDVMGKSPETFIFRGADARQIILFSIAVTVIPVLALSALAASTRVFGRQARRFAHLVVLGLLASVIAMQVLKRATPLRDLALLLPALAIGGVAAWLVSRARAAQTYIRLAAIAPIPFIAIFLFASPVSRLLETAETGGVAEDARAVPVVMVMFDEFPLGSLLDRRGRINETLYPNIAELAATSTWYRNYTVTERRTGQSIATKLTGNMLEDRSKRPLAADHPDNLFTLLSESHRLAVFEPVTAFCPEDLCQGSHEESEQSLDVRSSRGGVPALLSDAALVWSELSLPTESTRDVTTQFEELAEEAAAEEGAAPAGEADQGASLEVAFVESLRPGRPALHYVHLMLPHAPWRRFPDGDTYQILEGREDLPLGRGDTNFRPWVEEGWAVQLARQRHILQVQYTDRFIGRVMERLRRVGMFDETLLIITADHGVSLQPGRERRVPTPDNMHEIYWVPLFIRAPGQQEGIEDDRNLMAPDLLPTIADLLGTEVPWETDGRSAMDPVYDRGPVKEFVRREDEETPLPEVTMTIRSREAQRRLRREAYAPEAGCSGTVDLCPYLVGPGASLIGQSVDTFTLGPPSGLSADLVLPHTLRVDGEGSLPGLVLGTLTGISEGYEGQILVAVNGSVAGISETWTEDGMPGWFGVLAPERLLRPTGNELWLFELEGSVLRPIPIAG